MRRVTVKVFDDVELAQPEFVAGQTLGVVLQLGTQTWETFVRDTCRRSRGNVCVELGVSHDFFLEKPLDAVLRATVRRCHSNSDENGAHFVAASPTFYAEFPLARVRAEAKNTSYGFASVRKQLALRSVEGSDKAKSGELPITITLHRDIGGAIGGPSTVKKGGQWSSLPVTPGVVSVSELAVHPEPCIKRHVRLWVHATTAKGLQGIQQAGSVAASASRSPNDGVLAHPLAPRGIWFDANGAHVASEGTVNPPLAQALPEVWGLLGEVGALLGQTIGEWQIFRICRSEDSRGRIAKYAMALKQSCEAAWMMQRACEGACDYLVSGEDECIALRTEGGLRFEAVDAAHGCAVDVFLATPSQTGIPLWFFHPRPIRLRHISTPAAVEAVSGVLAPQLYGSACPVNLDAYRTPEVLPDVNCMLGRFIRTIIPVHHFGLYAEVVLRGRLPNKLCFDGRRRLLVAVEDGIARMADETKVDSGQHHIAVFLKDREGDIPLQPKVVGIDSNEVLIGGIAAGGMGAVVHVRGDGRTSVLAGGDGEVDKATRCSMEFRRSRSQSLILDPCEIASRTSEPASPLSTVLGSPISTPAVRRTRSGRDLVARGSIIVGGLEPQAFAIAPDDCNTLLVACALKRAIVRVSRTAAPGEDDAQVVRSLPGIPHDLLVLHNGELLILVDEDDGRGGQVFHCESVGGPLKTVVSDLPQPTAMCLCPDATLLVACGDHVRRYMSLKGPPKGERLNLPHLRAPAGIIFDLHGRLYVSDSAEACVYRYQGFGGPG